MDWAPTMQNSKKIKKIIGLSLGLGLIGFLLFFGSKLWLSDKKVPAIKKSGCEIASLVPQTTNLPASYLADLSNHLYSADQPIPTEVEQLGMNICYFYAFLSSYARQMPQALQKSIERVENGFDLSVYDAQGKASCVYISDAQLGGMLSDVAKKKYPLWPELLLAAWIARAKAKDVQSVLDLSIRNTGSDRAAGAKLLQEGKSIDMHLVMNDLFLYFLGKKGKVRRLKAKEGMPNKDFLQNEQELLKFIDSCSQKKCVMYGYVHPQGKVQGRHTETFMANGLHDHHCYEVIGIRNGNVYLRNAHGNRSVGVCYEGRDMKPCPVTNGEFEIRPADFIREFYTLQYSEF